MITTAKKQTIILLDQDDVLGNLVDHWIKILNARHKINISKEDITTWDIGKAVTAKFPELTSSEVYSPLSEPGTFGDSPILPGVREGLLEMQSLGWRPVIVTSLPTRDHNPGQVVQEKVEWIRKHLDGLIDPRDLVLTYKKYLVKGDVLIDDAPHNIESYPGHTIVFDQPWNREIEGTARVSDWSEVIDTCKKILSIKSWRR